jgi:hypothetical protein
LHLLPTEQVLLDGSPHAFEHSHSIRIIRHFVARIEPFEEVKLPALLYLRESKRDKVEKRWPTVSMEEEKMKKTNVGWDIG